ncbi:type II toxin-antitoxin system TacA family antitoxin [Endozoicomonas euniceicola]|uniref:DUF1778 domain-containing protein n=1 Tax=Endozoicomonas euniceicola TaxID=1234143 RepID=A0ABY6GV49_9GAMM|nr:DUF1778 domain-containing protein [Endozoicomonas euniceicola]UYM15913.1 DUF1778 domain-containing protein [Endozoicomonas euniceicola]
MAKTVPINMRVEPVQQALLTMAAAVLNKDRTAFILDVACREAMNVLLDQRVFTLDEAQTKAFEEALEAPVPEQSKLSKLLAEAAPWE